MENPWASRKRRWAASPSTSSSTHRMVFGRGIGLSYGDWRTRATQDLFGSVLCVLLVRFSSIGDILLTTPLVRALARRHPEAKLVYVTKRAMAPLVADNPHVAEVVALEPDEPLRHLARRLRALPPTHGPDPPGSLPSARPRRRPRHQALAHRALGRPGRAPARSRVPGRRRRRARRPRPRPAPRRRGRGRGGERRWRVLAPGDGRPAAARPRRRVGGYGHHAHGDRCGHAGRRSVRAYGRAVRVLPLRGCLGGARAPTRLPSLLGHGHRGVPLGPPSLPRRHHARRRGRRGGSPGRVIRATSPAEERLIGLVADAVRGPARQGLFALWLVLRPPQALLPPPPRTGRNPRRRRHATEDRLPRLR